MDRFHEMQVFLAVAEEEGFAAAARRLKTSPPSVTGPSPRWRRASALNCWHAPPAACT